jgi:hypothetical protein
MPEWTLSPSSLRIGLVHNNTAVPLSQTQFSVSNSTVSVKLAPVAVSLIPSVVQLRQVTSEVRIEGFGFAECAVDDYGWSIFLQEVTLEASPNMMQSSCRVFNPQTLLCYMPDWGDEYPAATIQVHVFDCLREAVQQSVPGALTIYLLPSVISIIPTTSSFKAAVPVTVLGKGFSSGTGHKVVFGGQVSMNSVSVRVVNRSALVAAPPNWGSVISQQFFDISVFTDKNELLGGWQQQPIFLLTHSIRRVFPSVLSATAGSTVTLYGLGFVPGRGYTCTFTAARDPSQVMSHNSGIAPGFTVIRCPVPMWGQVFGAGLVRVAATVPAQAAAIPADGENILDLVLEPAVYSVHPTVFLSSRMALVDVNGSGFGSNVTLKLRLTSELHSMVSADACWAHNSTDMTCPLPDWSALHPQSTVSVLFDVAASSDFGAVRVPPSIQIRFLGSIKRLSPTFGDIRGGTVVVFDCEGLFQHRRVVVVFVDGAGNVLRSVPEFPSTASSFVAATPNWLFSYPSAAAFAADVSVIVICTYHHALCCALALP